MQAIRFICNLLDFHGILLELHPRLRKEGSWLKTSTTNIAWLDVEDMTFRASTYRIELSSKIFSAICS
jgi:hypothetical protein